MHEPQLATIDAADVRALIVDVLSALGGGPEEARDQAWALIEADLRGRPSHGVQRLPVIAERIRRGLIVPGATPSLAWTAEAVVSVDGRRGFGPHIAMRAAAAIRERATSTGVHNPATLFTIAEEFCLTAAGAPGSALIAPGT